MHILVGFMSRCDGESTRQEAAACTVQFTSMWALQHIHFVENSALIDTRNNRTCLSVSSSLSLSLSLSASAYCNMVISLPHAECLWNLISTMMTKTTVPRDARYSCGDRVLRSQYICREHGFSIYNDDVRSVGHTNI